MLYNNQNKCFYLTKETILEFETREDALISEDIRSHAYSTEEIQNYIKCNQFQKVLVNCKSLAFKTLLFQYRNFESISIAFAVSRNKVERSNTYRKAIDSFGTIAVNDYGGYSPATLEEVENCGEYSFGLENIYENKDEINHLIIENDEKVPQDLLIELPEGLEPSVITNYKHIASAPIVDKYIRTKEDWTLWVHTQGMDIDLYKRFLTAYSKNIDTIMVKTESKDLVHSLAKDFPDISFKMI